MRRSDVLKILFVCVCVCHVCPAHPCGDNPLMLVQRFSEDRGLDPEGMLVYMREMAPEDYRQLLSDYRVYLECTQMVHTGYFKRSVDQNEALSTANLHHKDDVEKEFKNKFGETVRQLSRAHIRDSSRDIFNAMLETDTENSAVPAVPFVKLDDLPFIIKRLLRSKLSASHNRRNRRFPAKDV